jgi:hypothetical protein
VRDRWSSADHGQRLTRPSSLSEVAPGALLGLSGIVRNRPASCAGQAGVGRGAWRRQTRRTRRITRIGVLAPPAGLRPRTRPDRAPCASCSLMGTAGPRSGARLGARSVVPRPRRVCGDRLRGQTRRCPGWIVRLSPATSSDRPPAPNETAATAPGTAWKLSILRRERTSHRFTIPSVAPTASVRQPGLSATFQELTLGSDAAARTVVPKLRLPLRSQAIAVPSSPPV